MYCDSPLTMIHAIPGRSKQLDSETVLILPNGKALAQAEAHKEMRRCLLVPSTRSRWARVGLEVAPIIQMPDTKKHLPITLYNWSLSHSLVVRTGDTVVLTLLAWTDSLPLTATIALTADAVRLRMKENVLPKRKGVQCFDPHEADIRECMELVPYDLLRLKRNSFLVVPACELPSIADGYIALVASVRNGFHDNSARYIYPGPNGGVALEYKMLKPATLRPGQHIANLYICNALGALPPYQGELGRQDSIIPANWR